MLHASHVAVSARLADSLSTTDDSSDEDMGDYEQRMAISKSQETGLTSVKAEPPKTTHVSSQFRNPTPETHYPVAPNQGGFHNHIPNEHVNTRATIPARVGVANVTMPASPAVRQASKVLSIHDSSQIRKRALDVGGTTQSDHKKRRLDVALPITKGLGANSKGASDGTMTNAPEIIDVDELSDILLSENRLNSSSLQTAIGKELSRKQVPSLMSSSVPRATLQPTKKAAKKAPNSVTGESLLEPKVKKPTQKELRIREREQKVREEKMKLKEYIEILPVKFHNREALYHQFLEGTVILFARKMTETNNHLKKKLNMLYQHGATLFTTYDHERLTHIVTAGFGSETTSQINEWIGTLVPVSRIPVKIRIVSWSWVVDCQHYGRVVTPSRERYIHSHRWEKELGKAIEAPVRKDKRKEHVAISSEEEERREKAARRYGKQRGRVNVRPKSPSPQPKGSTTIIRDPLAEFYNMQESDEDDSELERQMDRYKFFRCMQKGGTVKGPCPNQDVVDKLQELLAVHSGRPGAEEQWKAMNMTRVIGLVRGYPTRFKSLDEAVGIKGIGEKTGRKIMEIINTGELRRLDYEMTEQTVVSQIFQGIYGVGPQLATQWFSLGLRTLEDVAQEKFGIQLTTAQKIGVQYYDDLRQRMPREEAKSIYDQVTEIALSLDPKLLIELMGSYRRGKDTCGDIDILITRDTSDGFDHRGLLPRILDKLHASGVIVADLGGEMGDDLEAKYMGICRQSPTGIARRIDILCIPYEQWGGALVYFTGDDIFNRSMRLLANKKGMSLNQRGLWSGVIRDSKTKLKTCTGTLIASRTEKEIFAALGVPWQEPHERVRS